MRSLFKNKLYPYKYPRESHSPSKDTLNRPLNVYVIRPLTQLRALHLSVR